MAFRTVRKTFSPPDTHEGSGVIVKRVIGGQSLPNLDPFLLLDYAYMQKSGGFPEHPHRGFETVSYILKGRTLHEDSKGHKGVLEAGDVQWMTAGRGIVHAEMPGSDEVEGTQLWVNLRSDMKMCEPSYQDFRDAELLKIEQPGVKIKVIAGEAFGQRSQIITKTPCTYLDVQLESGADFIQNINPNWNSLVYMLDGELTISEKKIVKGKAAVLETGQPQARFLATANSRFLLLAGEPIGQTIVKYGPFVMNTQREIDEAVRDYSRGRNGFQGTLGWTSTLTQGQD